MPGICRVADLALHLFCSASKSTEALTRRLGDLESRAIASETSEPVSP
jgi:hypothetical protein